MCYGCYDLAGDIVASQRTAAWATDLGVHHLPIEVAHRYRTQGPQEHPELTKQIRSDGGMREPIVLNTDGVRGYIHDGHHRLDSASSLGMTHVPVRVNRINEELTDYPPLDAHVHGILQGRTAAASLSFHPIPGHDTAIKAWLGDKPVGRIMWAGGDAPDGVPPYQVQHIDVHPDHLRQGVATAMFNHVQQNVEPRLRHSDQLSESGEAFVRSMQPRTAMPRQDAYSDTAAEPSIAHPPLPALWQDYQGWHHDIHGPDPEYTPHDSVQSWGNVEEYLNDRHDLPSHDPATYDHPTTLGMAKLHSLAQGRPQVDGQSGTEHYMLTDDDLTTGAAMGLLKIRRNNLTKRLEPIDPDERTAELIKRTAAPIWQKIPSDNTWGEDLDPDLGNDKPLTYSPRQPEDEPSGQWYHVSTQPLKPGTKIIPRGGESPDAGFYDDEGTGYDNANRQNHVWLAPSAKSAHDWSSSLNAPYIHEVKPGGKPQPWNYSGTNGWVVPHAHVTRQVSREELESRIPRSAPPTGELMQRAKEHFPYYMGDGDAKLPRDQWPHQDSPEYAQQVKNFMGDWPQKYPTFDPVGGPFTPHGKPGESHVNRLAELIIGDVTDWANSLPSWLSE